MPAKMARSAPWPPFGAPELRQSSAPPDCLARTRKFSVGSAGGDALASDAVYLASIALMDAAENSHPLAPDRIG